MEKTARMREPGRLTSDAIRDFFAGKFYQRIFAAMRLDNEKIALGRRQLILDFYALDAVELCRQFGIDLTLSEIAKWAHLASRPENMNNTAETAEIH